MDGQNRLSREDLLAICGPGAGARRGALSTVRMMGVIKAKSDGLDESIAYFDLVRPCKIKYYKLKLSGRFQISWLNNFGLGFVKN